MKKSSSPPPDIGGTLARVHRRSVQWVAILAPLTLAYLVGAFYLVRNTFGPSQLLSLTPKSAEATLIDLFCAIAPLLAAMALYMRGRERHAVARRRAFVSHYADDTLVKPCQYPGLVYRLSDEQMQIVWNADGAVHHGKRYPRIEDEHLIPFRPEHFIATGVP